MATGRAIARIGRMRNFDRWLFVGVCVLAGCGKDEGEEGFSVFPLKIYTGFDEGGSYSAPIAAMGATGVQWTSSNDAVAAVTGNDSLGTITGKAAGTAKVTVTAAGESMTVDITVEQFVSADKTAGQTVYGDFDCGLCHGATSDWD